MKAIICRKLAVLSAIYLGFALIAADAQQSDNSSGPGSQSQDSLSPLGGGGGGGGAGGGGGGRRGGGGRGARGGARGIPGVYKASIEPHWFSDNKEFWYRNILRGNTKEFILVDAEKGKRDFAFDHAKLAAGLSKAADKQYSGTALPFDAIEFVNSDKAVKFSADGKTWQCDLGSYEVTSASPEPALNELQKQEESRVSEVAVAANDQNPVEITPGFEFAAEASPLDQDSGQSPLGGGGGGGGGRGGRGGGGGGGGGRGGFGDPGPWTSPDGKWIVSLRDHNLYLKGANQGAADAEEAQMTTDGVENNSYGRISWAADSKSFVSWRIEPGDNGVVYRIQTSGQMDGRTQLFTDNYPQAGDKMTAYELSVFEVEGHKQIKPKTDRVDFGNPNVRWMKDGYHFTYQHEDRGHTRFRVIKVDSRTGEVVNVVDEVAKTFIWNMNTDGFRDGMTITTYLQNSEELIYESEMDGWRHLYLYDLVSGKLENQITKGEWLVRGFNRTNVDEEKRTVTFEAGGMIPGQHPYYLNVCRINLDGAGLVRMTDGDGDHTVVYSPDHKYLIDAYQRWDMAPVNNLRRVSDGSLVCKLEESDITELTSRPGGWKPAREQFVAKGRDGVTDIYGIIDRPADLDPTKKYPIVEDIYAGPQGSGGTMVPTGFAATGRNLQYTREGFIVVQIDGMGMPNRSKAFHDVAWHNLKDAGFPDRIAWMKALAAKYPYMDLDRVGIFGTSAGGQNAAAAVLFHPEFYKVAVANCGCHDNRIDKASWNEQWMGFLPKDKIWSTNEDNWFHESSNIDNAWRLQGKLFLIVGEIDSNVPPESTFRVVDALIKAGKYFDMMEVPGANHGASSPSNGAYTGRRTVEYLVRNLMQKDNTPNWNKPSGN